MLYYIYIIANLSDLREYFHIVGKGTKTNDCVYICIQSFVFKFIRLVHELILSLVSNLLMDLRIPPLQASQSNALPDYNQF